MQCVAVLIDFVRSLKGAALGRGIRVMTRYGQIGKEKPLPARQTVDPCQHPCHRGGFVHSEARIVIAANIARILQGLVPAMANNRLHS